MLWSNGIAWLVSALVVVGLGWLTWRAWRAKRWYIKWPGVVIGALLTLVALLVSVTSLLGMIQLSRTVPGQAQDLKVEGTPEQLARGEHIANSFCAGCHSTNGSAPLSGGRDIGQDFGIPLGAFVASNLTPAGRLKTWTDGQIFRALRDGVDPDGHPLFIMSGNNVRYLSDDDLKAVTAYLRTQPAVDNKTLEPADQPNLLFNMMFTLGMLPPTKPAVTAPITAPARGATAEYGKYILSYQDCRDCHGADLKGGKPGQLAPLGPNLAAVKGWTQAQLIQAMRTGVTPDGHQLSALMPWKQVGRLDDEELNAVHEYLASLQ
jgi:mono/diheme cytochrome c family protein